MLQVRVMMNEKLTESEFKETLLKILLKFDTFCKQHDIKYSLGCGTALGAVRHGGFIPWDDDIDVIMLRPEYDKFEKLWKEHIRSNSEHFKLWAEMDEENYFMAFCAKFFDTDTILYEHFGTRKTIEYGVYIDIFVLDHIPREKTEQRIYFKKFLFYWKWVQHFQRHFQKWNCFVRKYNLAVPSLDMIANKLMNHKNRYNQQLTSLVSITQDYQKKRDYNPSIFKYKWFEEFDEILFEGYSFPIVKSHHDMLEAMYGEYMILPPEEKRIGHNVEAYWRKK